MRPVLLALFVLAAALSAASAADVDVRRAAPRTSAARSYFVAPLPIAPDSLSATVLASDGCWRVCEARCGAHMRGCMKNAGLSLCLPLNDACERDCVKQCRAYGGPLLNWTD
jgi:hypothetical protein